MSCSLTTGFIYVVCCMYFPKPQHSDIYGIVREKYNTGRLLLNRRRIRYIIATDSDHFCCMCGNQRAQYRTLELLQHSNAVSQVKLSA